MGIDDRIVAKLNVELGSNVDNISRSKDLVNKFVNRLNKIEEKVRSGNFAKSLENYCNKISHFS